MKKDSPKWQHRVGAQDGHCLVCEPQFVLESQKREARVREMGSARNMVAQQESRPGERDCVDTITEHGTSNLLVRTREERQTTRSKRCIFERLRLHRAKAVCSHLNLRAQGRSRWAPWLEDSEGDFQPSSCPG